MEQLLGFELNIESLKTLGEQVFPLVQVFLIIAGAIVTRKIALRLLKRLQETYRISAQVITVSGKVVSTLIAISAFFFVLDRLGVSGAALWTAFTGFAAVAAVAFFAAWSVLSNIFCAFLIITMRPFRLYDYVEVLENGDKPGLKGQVTDINFIFSTLRERNEDGAETVLQIPNSLFFQRILRRWQGNHTPYSSAKKVAPAPDIELDFTPDKPLKPKGKK